MTSEFTISATSSIQGVGGSKNQYSDCGQGPIPFDVHVMLMPGCDCYLEFFDPIS